MTYAHYVEKKYFVYLAQKCAGWAESISGVPRRNFWLILNESEMASEYNHGAIIICD